MTSRLEKNASAILSRDSLNSQTYRDFVEDVLLFDTEKTVEPWVSILPAAIEEVFAAANKGEDEVLFLWQQEKEIANNLRKQLARISQTLLRRKGTELPEALHFPKKALAPAAKSVRTAETSRWKKLKKVFLGFAVLASFGSAIIVGPRYSVYHEVPRQEWLHKASNENDLLMVRLILGLCGNTRVADSDGWLPIHRACLGGATESAKLLLSHNATTKDKGQGQCQPLHLAARVGKISLLRLLLQQGAELEALDINGRAPLHEAAAQGHLRVCKILSQAGANIDRLDIEERTPVQLAAMEGHVECVKFFLSKGASLTPGKRYGWTALLGAAARGRTEVVKILLQASNENHELAPGLLFALSDSIRARHFAVSILLVNHWFTRYPGKALPKEQSDLIIKTKNKELLEIYEKSVFSRKETEQ